MSALDCNILRSYYVYFSIVMHLVTVPRNAYFDKINEINYLNMRMHLHSGWRVEK